MGRLIPAGTGLSAYKRLDVIALDHKGEHYPSRLQEEQALRQSQPLAIEAD